MRSGKAKNTGIFRVSDEVDTAALDTVYFMNLGFLKRINLVSNGRESTLDVIFDITDCP